MATNDSERRSRLLSIRLSALVRRHYGLDRDVEKNFEFPLGAAVIDSGQLWMFVDGDATFALGPCLAWSHKFALPVNIVVENNSGLLARRASRITHNVNVWHCHDSELFPAVIEPHDVAIVDENILERFADVIESSGADVVTEHGVLTGEIRGLEVCRVVHDEHIDDFRLEIGIGAHDREAFAMVHSDKPQQEALSSVVTTVLEHRFPGAPFHPYNSLAAERLLRWRVLNEPALIGQHTARAVEPPTKRHNVSDPAPCAAVGSDERGNSCLAVFVHGIHLDVVPWAIDAALMHSMEHVVIVTRPQDVVTSIREMARMAQMPIDFVALV